ncbi:NRDE family protein [Oceanobacillus saliphilus]|uniref:NRDE family protein n=1 Tax=Oceanobacillus saliphilus TaxID=2925834 RepID=UPI00201E40C4|nr:NRDE family protein [Oceanobacillus saliphilus]
MCLINFQFHNHPKYKLVIVANRDEFYKRPTSEAGFWEDYPEILAGRDLLLMGTWLGITKSGRIAALTNYRDPDMEGQNKTSRGEIVTNYLTTEVTPDEYLKNLSASNKRYAGFNVIVGNAEQLFYYNNIEDNIIKVSRGTHALSNHFLNTPWPKVRKGRSMLETYLNQNKDMNIDKLFEIVSDAEEAGDKELPHTGVGIELERKLSPLFIRTPDYGTRSSTVILIDHNNHVTFVERTYEKGIFLTEKHYTFDI